MTLRCHSDASYLPVSKRVHKLLGILISSIPQHISAPGHTPTISIQHGENLEPIPPINGVMHILWTIINM